MANRKKMNTKAAQIAFMQNIRNYRRNHGIAVADVEQYLKDHQIYSDVKTIYGWEKGVGFPSFDTVLLLCQFFQITDLNAFCQQEIEENIEMR